MQMVRMLLHSSVTKRISAWELNGRPGWETQNLPCTILHICLRIARWYSVIVKTGSKTAIFLAHRE